MRHGLVDRVIELHAAHPDWTARKLADALECSPQYINATAHRLGLVLVKVRPLAGRPRKPERMTLIMGFSFSPEQCAWVDRMAGLLAVSKTEIIRRAVSRAMRLDTTSMSAGEAPTSMQISAGAKNEQ